MSLLRNVTPGKMSQFGNPVVTAGECSLFGGFTQSQQETVIFTVVLHKLHTDVLQMCTQMWLADEYTDVVYVCRCVWS